MRKKSSLLAVEHMEMISFGFTYGKAPREADGKKTTM